MSALFGANFVQARGIKGPARSISWLVVVKGTQTKLCFFVLSFLVLFLCFSLGVWYIVRILYSYVYWLLWFGCQ